MRPKKKRAAPDQPDLIKDEVVETIGGTDGEMAGEDEDWGKTLEGEKVGGYGRLREQGDDDDDLI